MTKFRVTTKKVDTYHYIVEANDSIEAERVIRQADIETRRSLCIGGILANEKVIEVENASNCDAPDTVIE